MTTNEIEYYNHVMVWYGKRTDQSVRSPLARPNHNISEDDVMATQSYHMQRRHFQFIADVLWDLRHETAIDQPTLKMVAQEFARQLTRTNARFNADRFINATNGERK